MKTHFFEEHPFLICSEHQTKPIHKFSCFVPQNNPHFVNRLDYAETSHVSLGQCKDRGRLVANTPLSQSVRPDLTRPPDPTTRPDPQE